MLKAMAHIFNVLTGTSARHNKALRYVHDWAGTVQKFLTTYDLYGNSNMDSLLGNVGDAKFDLTSIGYKGRPLIERARNIKGQDISTPVLDITDRVESIRRYLINPALQVDVLGKAVLNLRSSFEMLQDALGNTKYM